MNFKKGFTLIELLVVVAIISLLASIVMASLSSARLKARDAKRMTEKREVITALNLYYDTYGKWPVTGTWRCFGAPSNESCAFGEFSGLDSLITDMAPYLSSFPKNNISNNAYGYNRMLFNSAVCANCLQDYWTNEPAGAYLEWMQEGPMDSSKCSSNFFTQQLDGIYWYCYEYLGP